MKDIAVAESPRSDEDAQLVAAVRGGDQEAFGRLLRKYQHRVIALAYGVLGDRGESEDVAQEAFLRVYRGLGAFRGASQFRTWLCQIALNTARTHRRRRRARPEATGQDDVLAAAKGADRLERAAEARDQVAQALGALPPELREAVLLRDVEGLDYKEIADVLHVPLGTVESRIFRGRQHLRQTWLTRPSTSRSSS